MNNQNEAYHLEKELFVEFKNHDGVDVIVSFGRVEKHLFDEYYMLEILGFDPFDVPFKESIFKVVTANDFIDSFLFFGSAEQPLRKIRERLREILEVAPEIDAGIDNPTSPASGLRG